MQMARGTVDRMAATSACSLDHPAAAAPLTQRQDGLNISLVRLVSFARILARRAKPTNAADSISDAANQPAPRVKPKPKSKKRTLTQELADRVGNKENASSASNSRPAQVVAGTATQLVQVAVDAAAKPAPAKRRLPLCVECKAWPLASKLIRRTKRSGLQSKAVLQQLEMYVCFGPALFCCRRCA